MQVKQVRTKCGKGKDKLWALRSRHCGFLHVRSKFMNDGRGSTGDLYPSFLL